MRMNTADSETQFFLRLEQLLAERHPELDLAAPASLERYEGPTPDLVVSNARTGSSLGLEMRVGFSGRHIPLAMLPQVRAVRERFRSCLPQPGDVVVIATGPIPRMVREGFARDGIQCYEVSSPEEAVERLDDRLEQLKSARWGERRSWVG
ncbi:MAG TPA: hypothetical protein VGB15_13815 [Longimicrobium sp.]